MGESVSYNFAITDEEGQLPTIAAVQVRIRAQNWSVQGGTGTGARAECAGPHWHRQG